jgi:hypothetical protein
MAAEAQAVHPTDPAIRHWVQRIRGGPADPAIRHWVQRIRGGPEAGSR